MRLSVAEMLKWLKESRIEYTYIGRKQLEITGFCPVDQPAEARITWVKHSADFNFGQLDPALEMLIVTDAAPEREVSPELNLIRCPNPKEAFFSLLSHFFVPEEPREISPSAVVETSQIGRDVSIGSHCYLSPETILGDHVTLGHHVVLEHRVTVGAGTVIHSGTVIGTDGYGYYTDEKGDNVKVPHFGGVVIGENVEIGANTCIDRGTLGDTFIGDNVKIDNLCHIAHNVCIQRNAMVIAQSMIAGSARLGENAYVAPGVLVMNQISVGRDSLLGLGAVVTRDVPDNKVVVGVPAKVIRDRNPQP